MKFINIMAHVAGLQFTEDWKSNGRQLVAVFLNLVTLLSCIYSIWYMLPGEDALIASGVIAFNLVVRGIELFKYSLCLKKCSPTGLDKIDCG